MSCINSQEYLLRIAVKRGRYITINVAFYQDIVYAFRKQFFPDEYRFNYICIVYIYSFDFFARAIFSY